MTGNLITIASESLAAAIDPLGAQLSAFRDAANHDLLWGGDPAIWKGRAPILFPIIGELADGRYRLGDQVYRLPRHGFARDRLFGVVEQTASSALFRLDWDAETFASYPFHFQLDIGFALANAGLSVTATIRNLGADTMPASFGFHPALRWPLPYGQPRDDHAIIFEKPEHASIRRLDAQGLVLPDPIPTPVAADTLILRDNLFAHDALIFDALASHRLRYGAEEGPQIRMEFSGLPMLGVWTKPGADFICIEPWHGMADPQGYSGDFRDKPGNFKVPPGGAQECRMTLRLD
jgi:galactose mutarotase-like enzyme